MQIRNYILSILFIFFTFLGNSQQAVLCSAQISSLKIESTTDIPDISTNNDGTINLVFADQDITDIFSNYIIYDFYQTSPNSSSDEILKYYSIFHNSKALVEDILTNIPTSIIEVLPFGSNNYGLPMKTTVSPEIVQLLDGNSYEVTSYVNTDDLFACNFDQSCPLVDVPNDFIFIVTFNYDTETELLHMENEDLSSCGNAFSITMTGGNPNEFSAIDDTLQLWESTLGTSNITEYTEPCHNIESTIFSVLGIACLNVNYGNIELSFDSETETFQLYRGNALQGYDIIEFSKTKLSIEEESFNLMKPFTTERDPYLHISNLNNQFIRVSIYNTSGQQIINSKTFEENTIDLSNVQTGLYFIRLSDLNNQHKTFKFLLN